MSIALNVIISGASVSGDVDVDRSKVTVDLGSSDKIGKATFDLQNSNGTYTNYLTSGNATFQIDAITNGVTKTIFRGTLEEENLVLDTRGGTKAQFTGYDYAQELLGLLSPNSRPVSPLDSGAVSLLDPARGDQGMGIKGSTDLILYVSGITSTITSGAPLNQFLSQYFGQSGDTTGSASGALFSFKPYFSGMTTWGTNPAYRTWYAQDGASDTNANYWIPYTSLFVSHEYGSDVIKKLTRQGHVVDRSGLKVQFEMYVGVSGDLHFRTSGTSDFVSSGASLIYYAAGKSGSANNNLIEVRSLPWRTTDVKNYIVGWFFDQTNFPLDGDDFTDIAAYSGGFWSGKVTTVFTAATLSGGPPSSNTGLVSIQATYFSGVNAAGGSLNFNFFKGTSINLNQYNAIRTDGTGVGVSLVFDGFNSANGTLTAATTASIYVYDSGGNAITNNANPTALVLSGWSHLTIPIFGSGGAFNSGTWAYISGAFDFTTINRIFFGYTMHCPVTATDVIEAIDNLYFSFDLPFSPSSTYNSGSIFNYGRRYEIFEYPYQTTKSGAFGLTLTELQSRAFSRQLGEFRVKDNASQVQLNITPGQAFVVDAPTLGTGSGQFFYYWVATEVRHEWDTKNGFETYIRAYPWFSGATVQSGQNLISYALTAPTPLPRSAQAMPNTTFWAVPYRIGRG